ncbi:MAG: histidine kinase [Planctomycetota bacterium]
MSEATSRDTVVMLSGDLMFSSKVRSVAERAGKQFRISGRLPEDNTEAIEFVILDLSTRSGLVPDIVNECHERCPNAKLIAYGPHVHVEKLKAARDAGISPVLTNGQFDASMASMFG